MTYRIIEKNGRYRIQTKVLCFWKTWRYHGIFADFDIREFPSYEKALTCLNDTLEKQRNDKQPWRTVKTLKV